MSAPGATMKARVSRRAGLAAQGAAIPRAFAALAAAAAALLAGCDGAIPLTQTPTAPPSIDSPAGFARLWSSHCAGCHGADGQLGPARPMRDPLYLASVTDADLTRVIASGSASGTLMPAFGRSSGGPLADEEIAAIVSGMRRAWGRSDAGASPIPYAVNARGDAARGRAIFDRSCASCHPGGNAADPFFLQLTSDQALRSAVIFGRLDLGMPGAAGPFPGRPPGETLSSKDVDDLVAWMAERRAKDWPPGTERRGGQP